jgi:excisionase family DNA binding protein
MLRICLNVCEAAAAMGCSTKTIRRMIADKRLPSSRLKTSRGKGRVVIKVSDLEKLLSQCKGAA